MQITYQFRLNPSKTKRHKIDALLAHCCDLYNAALEERISAYAKGISITKYDQYKSLTELRRDNSYIEFAVVSQRSVLNRLDNAFKSFFRRCKSGDKPGFPRFKGKRHYHSVDFLPTKINNNKLKLTGLGIIPFIRHRSIDGKIKLVRITKKIDTYVISFICEVEQAKQRTGDAIGIDLGLTDIITLSDGTAIKRVNSTKKHEIRLAKANQRLARARRGGANRQRKRTAVARVHRSIANFRQTRLHQISADLIKKYAYIAVEKLDIKGLIGKGNLDKHIHDASWASLLHMIHYKAAWAGSRVEEVDPRGTTQNCSGCDMKVPKALHDRWHDCPHCGLSLSRDMNAARNILSRADFNKGVAVLGSEMTANIGLIYST